MRLTSAGLRGASGDVGASSRFCRVAGSFVAAGVGVCSEEHRWPLRSGVQKWSVRGRVTGLIVPVLSRTLFLAYREANLKIFVALPINSQACGSLDEVAVKFFRVVCFQLCGEYSNYVPRDLETLFQKKILESEIC